MYVLIDYYYIINLSLRVAKLRFEYKKVVLMDRIYIK